MARPLKICLRSRRQVSSRRSQRRTKRKMMLKNEAKKEKMILTSRLVHLLRIVVTINDYDIGVESDPGN